MKINICGVDLQHQAWINAPNVPVHYPYLNHLSLPSDLLWHLHNDLSP